MLRPARLLTRLLAGARPVVTRDTLGTYQAIGDLVKRHVEGMPLPIETKDLTPYELRAFSQNGEDGVLAELIRRVHAPGRFFVEFGIETGIEGNCIFLADVLGWSGLFIEADEGKFASLTSKYASNRRVLTINAAVQPDSAERLFEQGRVPFELDVLSIDIDGNDYWVWAAIAEYRPRIVVIEYNASLGAERRLVQPLGSMASTYDGTDAFGASIAALTTLGRQKGYSLVHTDLSGVNAFFVRADLVVNLPAADEVRLRDCNYRLAGLRPRRSEPGASTSFIDLDAP